MTPATIIADPRADGIVLAMGQDGGLTFRGPSLATEKWVPILRDAKPAIVAHLRRTERVEPWDADDWRAYYDERAGIAEYDGGLARPEAEAWAWECCIAEWLNRHPVPSGSDRCHACGANGAREPLLPYGTETIGHAWLHASCWPPWCNARKGDAAAALKSLGVGSNFAKRIR